MSTVRPVTATQPLAANDPKDRLTVSWATPSSRAMSRRLMASLS
jgi:hypothetical protein